MKELIDQLNARFPEAHGQYRRKDIEEVAMDLGYENKEIRKIIKNADSVRWGIYALGTPSPAPTKPKLEVVKPMASITSISAEEVFIPQKDPTYIRWGYSKDVEAIIKSAQFFPLYIAGLSGNGKTMMVEQSCAKLKREHARVQITPETDEDDLLGGFRLINGETVFAKGPVVKAMEAGAILLIDEIDRGSTKLMALQGVLEGKPVLLKKTGEVVNPQPGFNVIATANTKGKGSDEGGFTAATIMDEALLERFSITMEQPYPTKIQEKKMIMNQMEKYGAIDEEFADRLSDWSEIIRKTYQADGIDDVISTRRLTHAIQTFSIFRDRKKTIDLITNRYDEDTKEAFLNLYEKIDITVGSLPSDYDEIPF